MRRLIFDSIDVNCSTEDLFMEIEEIEEEEEEEEEDRFLAFVNYARSVISPKEDREEEERIKDCDTNGRGSDSHRPGWCWIASRILKTCIAYSNRVTTAILLSELSQAWSEQRRFGAIKQRPEIIN